MSDFADRKGARWDNHLNAERQRAKVKLDPAPYRKPAALTPAGGFKGIFEVARPKTLSPNPWFSVSHTRTHAHSLSASHSPSHSLTPSPPLARSLSFTHTLSLSPTLSVPLSHSLWQALKFRMVSVHHHVCLSDRHKDRQTDRARERESLLTMCAHLCRHWSFGWWRASPGSTSSTTCTAGASARHPEAGSSRPSRSKAS